MKIKAKDLKTGMKIKDAHWFMIVLSVTNGFQKNGKPTVTVFGTATNTRKNKYNKQSPSYSSERTYKINTIVNV